jgi:RNA polymerase sigma-70 factor (ECF subfamily)
VEKELSSKEAYEDLFKTWYEPLCKYSCSILKDTSESEDIVQEVFMKLWDGRLEININTSVKSYLYRAVHNTSLNRVKQLTARDTYKEQIRIEEETDLNDGYRGLVESELNRSIKQAIAALPPKCRDIFEMSRFQMLSYKDIALRLDISPNTVENQIAKALKLLRKSLREFIPVICFIIKISGL